MERVLLPDLVDETVVLLELLGLCGLLALVDDVVVGLLALVDNVEGRFVVGLVGILVVGTPMDVGPGEATRVGAGVGVSPG